MIDTSWHWRLRFHTWFVGFVLALLFCVGAVQAQEAEPAREESSLVIEVEHVAAPVQSHRVFMPLVGTYRMPSSFTLIDRALAAGEIDEETALVYKVFATFGDGRLPGRFRGDNSRVVDSDAVPEATERYATLSAATRATVLPFLIPPIYRGSWYDLQARGAAGVAFTPDEQDQAPSDDPEPIEESCDELATDLFVPLGSDHFVVWYPPGDIGYWVWAQRTSQDLETRIYPTLVNIMGKAPLSDAGVACNPGDGRLDIYIAPHLAQNSSALAVVHTYPGTGCKSAPTYMTVRKHAPSDLGLLVHEFMHMIQFAYDVRGPCLGHAYTHWWVEATANWAVDAFETADPAPDDNLEQGYAINFLNRPADYLWSEVDERQYGAYLFPFYLARQFPPASGGRQIIPQIFAALEQEGGENLYSVIDARIDGGFAQRWAEFNLYNLNLPPNNPYQTWDNFSLRWGVDYLPRWRWPVNLTLQGQPQHTRTVGYYSPTTYFLISNLSASHLIVKPAQDVRLLAFGNTYLGVQQVKVNALTQKSDQSWQGPLDWTQHPWSILCLDQATPPLQQIIVLLTYSDWPEDLEQAPSSLPQGRSNGPLKVVGSNLGCARWRGTSFWQIEGRSWSAESEVTYTIRAEATPTFTLTRHSVTGDRLLLELQPVSGNATWTTAFEARNLQTGQVVRCDRSGQQALAPATGGLWITESLGRPQLERRFYGAGLVSAANQCPGLEPWATIPWLQTDLRDSDLRPWQGADGSRLRGNDSLSVSGDGYSYTITSGWDFTALRSTGVD